MKAAIVLVPGIEFQNRCNAWTVKLSQYGFGLLRLRLPAHVSLKQPFEIPSVEAVESFFIRLAGRIEPQKVYLKGFYYFGDQQQGVIGLNVVETPGLRQLHKELNSDLERELGGTQADFDGAAYHFHLTLSIGQPDSGNYERMLADLPGMEFDEQMLLNELALCLYEPLKDGGWEYGIYKRLILGSG